MPRPFSFHWGSGNVVEEAWMVGQWNEPAIQLLEYEDGSLTVRFAAYSHRGAFQRSPLMLDEKDVPDVRKALESCPRLRSLLQRLVSAT
ncbi:MAG: hypothetical protein EXR52_01760 [Dehalococcoidia bacterium]|nr:hypothetical protein [Dehalococcoidia bacterium]